MKTRLSQPDSLDEQQLARKSEIRDSWSLQERERRRRVSSVRQQWLAGLVLDATNQQSHVLPDFQTPISVVLPQILKQNAGIARRQLSAQ